ncbi:UNVERIFIED_CONTAM: hypothetical protein GTU68_021041 [Idotea baltica]|nr:hypothetical protein [Idotea baltica]
MLPTPPTAITVPMQKPSRFCLIPASSAIERYWNSSFKSTIHPHPTVRVTIWGCPIVPPSTIAMLPKRRPLETP